MKVAFRTDASRRIGTGHVMRCLALAGALRERGAEISFVCRELDGHLLAVVREQGFGAHALPPSAAPGGAGNGTPHAHWLETGWRSDARETRAALAGGVDVLVVDHYALDADWERELRPVAHQILAIDDLADRAHDADLLLDPAPQDAARYAERVPRACRLLLGPSYALLRPEFARQRAGVRARDGSARRLFVSFGGIDPTGETEKALEALRLLARPGLQADVVVGGGNPRAAAVRDACRAMPGVQFHQAPGEIASLMAAADLGLGAGGIMTWERACLGLPSLVLVIADNQMPGARMLAAAGQVEALGAAGTTAADLARALEGLLNQPERLREMSRRNLELVDGRGASRVARLLVPPPLALRRAGEADRGAIFEWRNHESVRRFSNDPAPIARASHDRWFGSVLADPARVLLVAEQEGRPVAVLRYDLAGEVARVSIYLVPDHAGRGLGPAVLRAGHDWLRRQHPAVRRVDAEVLPGNDASRRAFTEAGYRLDGPLYRAPL